MKKILIIGQLTLHRGRLEYGNVGNYYIVEVLFEQLLRVFPSCNLRTTFQMSDFFMSKYSDIEYLDANLFYDENSDNLIICKNEYDFALQYCKNREFALKNLSITPYINEILDSDLVIDCSGEMWGQHVDEIGRDRFLVGLYKVRIAQLLGKKTVMVGNGQGPFCDKNLCFIKEVFENFSLVLNREPESVNKIKEYRFNTDKVYTTSCPSWLFNPIDKFDAINLLNHEGIFKKNNIKLLGFTLCGWNFNSGDYKTARNDDEFLDFVKLLEYIYINYNIEIVLISHTNAFVPKDLNTPDFRLINGRDFVIIQQLYDIILDRGNIDLSGIHILRSPYMPNEIKGIIGQFDYFVTGRLHAAVAALSQNVPTIGLEYGCGVASHKFKGFFDLVGIPQFRVECSYDLMKLAIDNMLLNEENYRRYLELTIPKIIDIAKKQFDFIRELIY